MVELQSLTVDRGVSYVVMKVLEKKVLRKRILIGKIIVSQSTTETRNIIWAVITSTFHISLLG
jgi:hypothetical protein